MIICEESAEEDVLASNDGKGNYTLGLKDQMIFPEIDISKVDLSKGMNVTIVTTATRDDHSLALLEKLGFPFTRPNQ